MKKMMIAGGAAALALTAVIGGVAVAQQAPAERSAARADADRDGRITQAEFVQARVQRLTAMDANNDGSVTAEERAAGKQAQRAERVAARFDRLDTDRNGSISRAEFEARPERAGRGQRAGKGPGGPRGERMAARREARGPVVIAEAQAKATQAFARLDVDNDGAVTVEERRGARQQMREGRQERRAERMARREARGTQTPPSPPAPASE